jgi:alkyl hydroperoxide reductase subunit F
MNPADFTDPPDQEERLAMDKKVKIYTTSTCHYCQQAKDFLTEKGIPFEAVDVSQDKEALQEMKKISGGARSVPVISVCDEVMVGFDREAMEKALKCLES